MMPHLRKRVLWTTILIVLTAIVYTLHLSATIATGYCAKILCSGVFVSERTAQDVISAELAAFDYVNHEVDYDNKCVISNVLGIVSRTAVFRPGLGAVLAIDSEPTDLQNMSVPAVWQEDLQAAHASIESNIQAPVETETLSEIDSLALATAVKNAFYDRDPITTAGTRAVVVMHRGAVLAEEYAEGFDSNTRLQGWSMTKSVTHALIGILVREGKTDIHDPGVFTEWQDQADSRSAITIDHLLRMSSGLAFVEDYGNPFEDALQMLFASHAAASLPLEAEASTSPDSIWAYSSGTSNLLSLAIRRTAGPDSVYHSFPHRELFAPIGMTSAVLETDASGTFVGSSFMYATATDWARFGQLYLNDGIWANRRILPEGWVQYARTPTSKAPRGKYGAHFWLNHGAPDSSGRDRLYPSIPMDMYFCSGFEGQFICIVPSEDLVVVRLGLSTTDNRFDIEKLVFEVLSSINPEGF